MNKEKVHINYFYKIFRNRYCERVQEENKKKINGSDENIFSYFNSTSLNDEEKLSIFNQSLLDICTDYITISNSNIDIIPNNSIELINKILDESNNNPYEESFLCSLQFIYIDYLGSLEKGDSILSSRKSDTLPSTLIVTLDSQYKMTELEAVNMSLKEQTKIISEIFKVEYNNQLGPYHPKVNIKVRKDI